MCINCVNGCEPMCLFPGTYEWAMRMGRKLHVPNFVRMMCLLHRRLRRIGYRIRSKKKSSGTMG